MKKKKKIIVRYGLPNIDKMIKSLEDVSGHEKNSAEFNKELEFYLKCRVGDYNKSKEIIERESIRQKKINKCINFVIDNMVENEGTRKHLRVKYTK